MENSLLPKLQMCEIKLQNTTNGLGFFFFFWQKWYIHICISMSGKEWKSKMPTKKERPHGHYAFQHTHSIPSHYCFYLTTWNQPCLFHTSYVRIPYRGKVAVWQRWHQSKYMMRTAQSSICNMISYILYPKQNSRVTLEGISTQLYVQF